MRIIKQNCPWGENKYKDLYSEMVNNVKQINPNYKIDFLQGIQQNDVMIAYI